MIHDANWPKEISFKEAIGPIATSSLPPFLMLRTCKADTVAGVQGKRYDELCNKDKEWMVNGKYGIIQYFEPISSKTGSE